jgi:peptidyl-prolyl cis-trans isomerase SurA
MVRVSTRLARLSYLALVVGCGGVAISCGWGSRDPAKTIAAEVGGTRITVAQVNAFFDANLLQPDEAEAPSAKDLNEVKSRLLDDFLDEEILYQEALRRGLSVSDAELAGYLGADAPKDPEARALAGRDLTIQKLREKEVLSRVAVDDKEIDAWIAAHAGEAEPPVHGALRVLRFASGAEALRVRNDILAGKLTFERAELAYGGGIPGEPKDVDLGALPDELASAVRGLKPGEVSEPVPFESSVVLVRLESLDDAAAGKARLRGRARQEIALSKAEVVSDALLSGLRKTTPIKLHRRALPFTYVAAGPTGGAQ